MPERLRDLGLAQKLGTETPHRVEPPPYQPDPDPPSGVRNAEAIAIYSRTLAETIGQMLDTGYFPLVIGGDCSVLLGSALALAQRGRFGLAYLDGHQDLLTPSSSLSKAAAGMGIALVTGQGPSVLTSLGERYPLMQPQDIALIGFRDDEAVYSDSTIDSIREETCRLSLEDVRAQGPAMTASRVLDELLRPNVDGVWVHLDADVLEDHTMPAVDDRQPGGMTHEELCEMLAPLLASERVVGMQVTIYDPTLDPTAEAGTLLVDTLVRVLGPITDS